MMTKNQNDPLKNLRLLQIKEKQGQIFVAV